MTGDERTVTTGIPSEVTHFLTLCGIAYPDIDENDVRALAGHVRTFAEQVRDTHESATGVIDQMGAFYSAESYRRLAATWSSMSADHIRRLDRACELADRALEGAATVITEVKAAVLAALAALAAAHASLMVTPTLVSSAPLVVAAARGLCAEMSRRLVGYIVAEVVGKAIRPLEQAIDDMVRGIVYDATRDALDVPSSCGHTTPRIHPDAVQHFAKVLDDHADDIMRHAAAFAENVSTLDFGRWTALGDVAEPNAADAGKRAGAAATPWGRAGLPPGASNPVPHRRRPAVTPWTKARSSRDVPAVVHAPSTRPRLRLVREKGAEADSAEFAVLADANSVRSRVMTPAAERTDAPPARG